MVYKIRNKNFFNTFSGFKNNYRPRVIAEVSEIRPFRTFALKDHGNLHTFIRMHQVYRNISRKCKQYFYGNKELEEIFIVNLRKIFHLPKTFETPYELVLGGPARRFTEHLERDYELISGNCHPYQLDMYAQTNEMVREETERKEMLERGEKPLDVQFSEWFIGKMEEVKSKTGRATVSDMHKIFEDGLYMYVQAQGGGQMGSEKCDFKDFLEERRPFANRDATR